MSEKKVKKITFLILLTAVLYIVIFCAVYFIDLGTALESTASAREKKAGNFAMLNENIKDAETVFFGDSITEMYDLDKYFKDKKYINRGISGDTTQGAINRIESNIINLNPKLIVLLFGVNDLNNGCTIKEIVDNYETILNIIQQRLPQCKVIVQSVYPVNNFKSLFTFTITNKRINADIDLLNLSLSSLVAKFGYDFVNLNSMLKDSHGYLQEQFTIDGLHLKSNAYKKISERLIPHIEKSLQTIIE